MWTVENATKTLVWTKNFLSVLKKQKTEVFENALVWTGPEQDYKLEIHDSQNLAENEEQRNLRLQRLRESQSIRIQAETKQQRHDRLQITRDNTARRTTKQTPTASTKCCYVQREQEPPTSTRSK